MKIVKKFFVDDKEVSQEEYEKILKSDGLHCFKIETAEEPETLEDRMIKLENDVKELREENEDLKKRVLSLEITKTITVQPYTTPDTNPWPWQPNVIYCSDPNMTMSCSGEYKLVHKS